MDRKGLASITSVLLLAACGGAGGGGPGMASGGDGGIGGSAGAEVGGEGGTAGLGGQGGTVDPEAPAVEALVPDTGLVGTIVELRGRNLEASRELLVMFRPGVAGRVLAADREGAWIRAVVPPGATSGPVGLRLDGESHLGPDFTVIEGSPLPYLERLSPDYVMAGAPATTVRLQGWGFCETSRLLLDDRPLAPVRVTAAEVEVRLPETLLQAAGRRLFRVENPAPGGGSSEALAFQVSGPFNVLAAVPLDRTTVKIVFDQPPSEEGGSDVRNFRFECTS